MKKMNEVWSIAVLVGYILTSAVAAVSVQDKIRRSSEHTRKLILDVDAGADDGFALSLAVLNEELFDGPEVIAITCVRGNTVVHNVVSNVLRTLQVLEREDIPVYAGTNQSLLDTPPTDNYFGVDGFGNFSYNAMSLNHPEKEHAVLALIRLVHQYPGKITLIALGPLTNLALAQRLDPSFLSNLESLLIMGGSISGVGNVKPGVEFNFYFDPEAAAVVLKEINATKMSLVPWETIINMNISYEWRRDILGKVDNKVVQFLNKAENVRNSTEENWASADAVTVATLLWPDFVTKSSDLEVTAVTSGEARGGLLVQYSKKKQTSGAKLNVVLAVNETVFKDNLLNKYFLPDERI